MFVLGFTLGALSTVTVALIIILVKKYKSESEPRKNRKEKYIRRGLFSGGFTRTYGNDETLTEEYTVTAEIGEVERTKTKSKIEVIELRVSITSDETNKQQIIDIIEGWKDSNDSEIEWFEKHPGDERAEKIDELLNED